MSLCSRDFNINIWALLGIPFGILLFSQSKLIVGLCSKHYRLQTSFSGSGINDNSVGIGLTLKSFVNTLIVVALVCIPSAAIAPRPDNGPTYIFHLM